ncbi:MAG: phosphoenolpyruvate carboxykinase (ATP) [Bryobacterales bacterium]
MEDVGASPDGHGLEEHGLHNLGTVHWNLGQARLLEESLQRGEGRLAENGSLIVRTGQYTGRSPKDRYIVSDEISEKAVDWGEVNRPMSPGNFERLFQKIRVYLQGRDVFVQDCLAGADVNYTLPIRAITELAWHNLFARQLLVRPSGPDAGDRSPECTIIYAPGLQADPATDGTRSEAFVVLSFSRKMVLIGGTRYAGELKKSVFSLMNFLLPSQNVLPMHCSANVGAGGGTALFFGLSGTGKTTLSADPERGLIGDDEHGWSGAGIFNFEGGCYAKCIRLSKKNEPQIWDAIRFGTVLENVAFDANTREIDYDDGSLTENTRAAYPVEFIDNAVIPGVGGHPANIVFLTADAFGVLPPISKLTPEQAMYHFLSGYTSKVAGTERGLGSEPAATFSACFGSPFLPRSPAVYAEMLGERMRRHKTQCWLVNTGWVGGRFGVGKRMDLPHTRAMLTAALDGKLNGVEFTPHAVFGVAMPKSCPGVPPEVLDPRGLWKSPDDYDQAAQALADRFERNFEKFTDASDAVKAAGPRKGKVSLSR